MEYRYDLGTLISHDEEERPTDASKNEGDVDKISAVLWDFQIEIIISAQYARCNDVAEIGLLQGSHSRVTADGEVSPIRQPHLRSPPAPAQQANCVGYCSHVRTSYL